MFVLKVVSCLASNQFKTQRREKNIIPLCHLTEKKKNYYN